VGVGGALAVQRLLHFQRQGLVGHLLGGEQGVAAFGRQLPGVEHRAQAGDFLVGQVRVPELAGVAQAGRLTVLDDVGDDEDLRVAGQQELAQHVDLQLAEAAAEGDVLFRGQVLVAEDHYAVIQMGAMHTGEIGVVERAGQVDADDLGAEHGVQRTDLERLGGCGGGRNNRIHGKQLLAKLGFSQGTSRRTRALDTDARLNGLPMSTRLQWRRLYGYKNFKRNSFSSYEYVRGSERRARGR